MKPEENLTPTLTPEDPKPPPKSCNRVWITVEAIVFVAIIGIGGYFLWSGTQQQTQPQDKIVNTEDEAADWKTYRNEEYGFEVKYPASHYIYFEGDHIFVQDETRKTVVGMTPFNNYSDLSLQNFLKENTRLLIGGEGEYENLLTNEPIELNGLQGIKYGMERDTYIMFGKEDVIVRLYIGNYFISLLSDIEHAEKVLANFKFIESQ